MSEKLAVLNRSNISGGISLLYQQIPAFAEGCRGMSDV
jgi:hypothetical protein